MEFKTLFTLFVVLCALAMFCAGHPNKKVDEIGSVVAGGLVLCIFLNVIYIIWFSF